MQLVGQKQNMGIVIRSPQEIAIMREAGRIVAAVLDVLSKEVRPGTTTAKLDAVAARELKKRESVASFKGYRGFPASICASVNEEVVHGIPGERVLREGDIISIDIGAIFQGFHADAAITLGVGSINTEAKNLIMVTKDALKAGIATARSGFRLGDVSAAIQSYAESRGFSVVREYVGHGIGREMHEEPQIPNFGVAGTGTLLHKGMTIALEPMLNAGVWRTKVAENKWTVLTADGKLSAHAEHTVAITDDGAEILTQL
ncbi:type I methionyl aminopeptidase [Chloroflexota bacterium]